MARATPRQLVLLAVLLLSWHVCSASAQTTCPNNTVQLWPGSSCTQCESGFVPSENQTYCVACAENTYARGGDAACTACEPGTAAAERETRRAGKERKRADLELVGPLEGQHMPHTGRESA